MLLAVDVGNTQTVLGLYAGDRLTEDWRIATERTRTGDELGVLLGGMLDLDAVGGICLSSTGSRSAGRRRRSSSSAQASRRASRSATTIRVRSARIASSTRSPPRSATAPR